MRLSALLVLVFFAVACGSHAGSKLPHGIGATTAHRIESQTLGRGFDLHVLVPDTGHPAPEAGYPTLYLLDGGLLFPLIAGYYRYLDLDDEVPAMIIVGISYPGVGFENGNYRGTDFTAPSAERDYYGGAGQFQTFLRKELFPFIESRFASRADARIVLGHSLGGQFVLHAAQTEPTLFWGYIASNPALHRNLEFFLTTRPKETTNARLFVASGTLDDPRFREPARAWIDHWSAVEQPPWRLKIVEPVGHTHLSLPPVAFRQGIAWLFSEP